MCAFRTVTSATAAVAMTILFSATAAQAAEPLVSSNASTSSSHAQVKVDSTARTIPQRAWKTLHLIDEGEWPPNDGSGTKGGTTWPNREGTLPKTDHSGNPIHYREWDVNRKHPGRPRDSERIVTGSDGSAWYTPDAFRSFARMR